MCRSVFIIACNVLVCCEPLVAAGLLDVAVKNKENKVFWNDHAIVITGVVEKVERPKKPWVVITLRPTGLISGNFDPGAQSTMRIGCIGESHSLFATPRESDRIMVIVTRVPREVPLDLPDGNPFEVDFMLPYIMVRGETTLGALSKIKSDDDTRVESLLRTIRMIRSPSE